MKLQEKAIAEFQRIYKKEYGKELPYEEAEEQANHLIRFSELMIDMYIRDEKRKDRLKTEPKGFPLDGVGYTCPICRQSTREGEVWFDKYGIKCLTCKKGIDRKEIPASMAKFTDKWYSKYDMESRFGLKTPTLKKWVRNGILKSRCITNDGKGIHAEIFLIKDNKNFLPPKELTKSQSVQEDKDGQTSIHSEPWYRFVDPYKHLEGYEIMNYLNFVKSDE